jgi:Bacterial inner membrane protein
MIEWIGWIATAVFAVSYVCRRPAALRRVQALAATLWIIYGITIKAPPVIVANLVVAGVAIISSFQQRDPQQPLESAAQIDKLS